MQKVRLAAPLLAALILATSAQTAPPGPNVRLAYATPAYSSAASCDLSKPLAVVHLLVTNPGNAPTAAGVLFADDRLGSLGGSAPIPPLAAGATQPVELPLQHIGLSDPGALGGTHPISLLVRGSSAFLGLALEFPPNLCPHGPTHPKVRNTASPKPGVEQVATNKGRDWNAVLAPVTPANLRSVSDRADCGVHVGPLGAFVCPDMMKSGDVLLIWDYQPSDIADIDGYHIYRVAGTPTLIGTQTTKGVTLYDVPKPPGATYDGNCYSITAYAGKRESKQSNQFCAGANSSAKTVTFAPAVDLSISRYSFKMHERAPVNETQKSIRKVGYSYGATTDVFGDSSYAWISRYAMFFDVRSLLGRHVVEAHLSLSVLPSALGDPNCTTSIGFGTEDWWSASRWPDGYFIAPDMQMLGSELRINLTNAVQNWMFGRLNQGVILRNDNENLNAFTTAKCTTYYSKGMLSVTYY